MGLGWGEAVPVDTHVWQIAQRDYKFGKGKQRSLTKATYDAVGDYFRSLWGKEAGWAHSVLFAADLRAFAVRLSTKREVDIVETANKDDGTTLRETIAAKRQIVVEEMAEDIDDKSLVDSRMRRRRIK